MMQEILQLNCNPQIKKQPLDMLQLQTVADVMHMSFNASLRLFLMTDVAVNLWLV